MLTDEELDKVQFDAAQEDVFRGMQLRDGRYHFTPGHDSLTGLRGRIRFKVDGLLMEAVRRIDEIGGLRETFFSNDLTIRRTDVEVDVEERSPSERKLLGLLGRENMLGVLVANGRMAEFDTLSYLEQLREADIISVQSRGRPEPEVDEAVTRRAGRKQRYSRRPLLLSTLSILAAAAIIFFQPFSVYRDGNAGDEVGTRYMLERDRAELVAAIQLYTLERSRPPSSLDDLQLDDWLSPQTLKRCRRQFEYEVSGSRWSLAERDET